MTPEEVAPGCHPTISHVMHGPMQKIQILFPDTLMEMPRHRVRRWVRFMRQRWSMGTRTTEARGSIRNMGRVTLQRSSLIRMITALRR